MDERPGGAQMAQFLKTTVLGGFVFLIPIVILFAVVGRGLEITHVIAEPLAKILPIQSVAGLAVAELLGGVLLILVCFVAGLLGRTARAQQVVDGLEASFLTKIPAYALLKTKAQSMLSPDDVQDMKPVVVRFDDYSQVAFEIEPVDGERVAVFLPGAPDAWSGTVCVVATERVAPLNLSILTVAKIAKQLGRGTDRALCDPQMAST